MNNSYPHSTLMVVGTPEEISDFKNKVSLKTKEKQEIFSFEKFSPITEPAPNFINSTLSINKEKLNLEYWGINKDTEVVLLEETPNMVVYALRYDDDNFLRQHYLRVPLKAITNGSQNFPGMTFVLLTHTGLVGRFYIENGDVLDKKTQPLDHRLHNTTTFSHMAFSENSISELNLYFNVKMLENPYDIRNENEIEAEIVVKINSIDKFLSIEPTPVGIPSYKAVRTSKTILDHGFISIEISRIEWSSLSSHAFFRKELNNLLSLDSFKEEVRLFKDKTILSNAIPVLVELSDKAKNFKL